MSLWLIPMIYAAASFLGGITLQRLEQAYFPYDSGISVASAQAFLTAVASGMIALTGIVFTVSLVMVQFSAIAYSPRLVLLLARDPKLFHSLGVFIATFTYSLSVLLYRRRVPGEEISSGAGFRLGALSGLFGFAIVVVLTAATIFISHGEGDVRDAMLQTIRQAQARNPDLQARQVLDFFTTPQGLIVVMVLSFFFAGIMFVLLSGLGGSISATLQRRRRPRA